MGVFSDLMNKIFRRDAHAGQPAPPSAPGAPTASPGSAGGAAVATPVDVAAILDKMAAENSQKLDWKHSIVDLMKLVGIDSSLANRKALAAELKYTGNTNDTAPMNIWLHKQVMQKLAENGGKVPKELLD